MFLGVDLFSKTTGQNFSLSLTIRYFFLLFDMFILQPWVHPQLSHCNLERILLSINAL